MSNLLDHYLLPLKLPFMQNSLLIALTIAIPMAMLSCLLILKRWSLIGDGISHSILPGVVLAYIIRIPLEIGAFAAGMFCSLSVGYLKNKSSIKDDTLLGIVFSGMFALGVMMMVKVESDVHLEHILFGDMLGISSSDLLNTALIALITFVFLILKGADLMLCAFDPQHARAICLPLKFLHYGLLISISLVVVGALKSTGLILSIALLILPGSIAYLIARTYKSMIIISIAVAVICCFIGVYFSFFINSAPAPTIVLTMTTTFITAAIYSNLRSYRLSKKNFS
ncbi:Manganese ABC transporter, inner membrane permease protein SitD [Liberibacter crescens BT-1]|uniref:Manganese ABC transporter, inner membrane permease protein SitD n=1 Tax=Liberibacter crescens (strain BT-1) TaxID=1215343 RepID=L0EU08_LIBCB|nr:metal ABC transporter permease [Liberibacter crescens]AGA65009.1 Manganese ABC transporter, inner membrane permease protein SitD [Liberibacter crescens BT-1]AMC13017.1 membrane protein [Liberibacter crescens]